MNKYSGLLLLMTIALLLPIPRPSYTDTRYSNNRHHILIECVEEYNGDNLKYVCDAATLFKNKLYNTGSYDYWFFSNDAAWPGDWWTKEARYYHYYPVYHAYKQDYAVFLGHADVGRFIFSHQSRASNDVRYSEVWLVLQGPNGASWLYPHDDDGDGVYTRWITVFGCQLLNGDGYSSIGYSIFDVFHYTFSNQSRSPIYLHGIVGARTDMVDWYKPCSICGEVKASVDTMNDYAERLIAGESMTDSWFEAVWTYNNIKNIWGQIVFQAHPAALYTIVKFVDSQGNVLASYDYKNEGMLGFSNTIYPAPSQLEPPPGTAQVVVVEVYLIG